MFQKILNNYKALIDLWEQSLKVKLDFDTNSNIGGFKNQMKLFKFYFGLNLSQCFYAITDNLSKTLQQEKMSAVKGNDFIVQILQNMRLSMILSCYTKKKSDG